MISITVVSDLHLEFSTIKLENTQGADVLILSGDIGMSQLLHDFPVEQADPIYNRARYQMAMDFREFLKDCSNSFTNVIYISGNHEFYQGKFHDGLAYLKEECLR